MDAKTICPVCGNLNTEIRTGQSYQFKESGLDDVYLLNVDISHCPACKVDMVAIPDPTQLLRCLGELIVLSPSLLTGPEIRFLRKNLHTKINDFAKLLGVDRVTLSRWENKQAKITKSNDRLIRLTYVIKSTVSDEVRDEVRKRLEQDDTKKHKPYSLKFPLDRFACATPAMA
ncbi:MAG: type II TA system antitoxin MqsA family protein [Syntrophobacteraceae bacterium]|jgi:putative zinc finger/helix-turn-helix YgiT family protein